eukprot:gnl/MRDRNA2_/MRDRNA2_20233_c0_seq1.p1 gnl/MRDRNA2_/MRDRNA2_20233_c0~~gnl/MRDRNA2_/MRDRNA2_20233_c0_seq1.p1  ORF type:complete len:607 (+),score=90.58 gnl/MRDRNA2_/MRDRNA2_20233_c0_seq1:51-1871(+)
MITNCVKWSPTHYVCDYMLRLLTLIGLVEGSPCAPGEKIRALYPGYVLGNLCTAQREDCWFTGKVALPYTLPKEFNFLNENLVLVDWDDGDEFFRLVSSMFVLNLASGEMCTSAQGTVPRLIHQSAPRNQSAWDLIWMPSQTSWSEACRTADGYRYITWDDDEPRRLIAYFTPEYLEAYDGYERRIRQLDFERMVTLLVYGGVYVDMDMEVVQSCPFVAFPNAGVAIVESPIAKMEKFQNSLMMSSPGHPFWRFALHEAVLRATNHTNLRDTGPGSPWHTLNLTGPQFISDVVSSWNEQDAGVNRVHSLPAARFNVPAAVMSRYLRDGDPRAKNALLKHHTTQSWVSEEDGDGLLFKGARKGQCDMVEALLSGPDAPAIDINVVGKGGSTVLHWSVIRGHLPMAELLVNHGANLSVLDGNEQEAVHLAAKLGRLDILRYLLDARAHIHAKSRQTGQQPLHKAVNAGHLEIVEHLVHLRVDVLSTAQDGMSAVHRAAWKGNLPVLSLLVRQPGALELPGQRGAPPLSAAIVGGHVSAVTVLHQAKADLRAKDHAGIEPLQYAVSYSHLGIVKTLLQLEPDLSSMREDPQFLRLVHTKGRKDLVDYFT